MRFVTRIAQSVTQIYLYILKHRQRHTGVKAFTPICAGRCFSVEAVKEF